MPGGSPEFAGQPVETNRCVPHSVRDPVLKNKSGTLTQRKTSKVDFWPPHTSEHALSHKLAHIREHVHTHAHRQDHMIKQP